MPLFKAPLIYTASDMGTLQDHIIKTDDHGTIQAIDRASRFTTHGEKLFETNGQLLDLTVHNNQYTSNNPNDVTVATILMNNIGNATTLK